MQINSMPKRHRARRWIVKVSSIAFLLLLALWLRVFYGSMQDYRTGQTLLKETQTIRAITYFDRSLHWYAPLNPYVEKSAKRLWEIGERAEQEKDIRMALIAYESIRNGFYGVSHVLRPGKDWIQRAEAKLHALSALQGRAETAPSKKDPQPHVLWSVVAVIGFVGWVGSLAGFARWVLGREKQPDDRFNRRFLWISLVLFFFGLWILGMALV